MAPDCKMAQVTKWWQGLFLSDVIEKLDEYIEKRMKKSEYSRTL
jgi:hypothetical protein